MALPYFSVFFYVVRYILMRHIKVITYFFRSVAPWHYLTSRCCLYLCKNSENFGKITKLGSFSIFLENMFNFSSLYLLSKMAARAVPPQGRKLEFFVKTQTLTTYKKITTTPPFLWQNTPLTGLNTTSK